MTDHSIALYAASALIVAWALYGVFGPRIKQGKRSRHTAFWVMLTGNPHSRVQEMGEWRLAKIVSVTLGAITVALLAWLEPSLPAVFGFILPWFAMAIGERFRTSFLSDSAGHGAEIMSAERAGHVDYRAEEIGRLNWESNWQKALGFAPGTALAHTKIAQRLDDTRWLADFVYWLGRSR